MMNESNLKKANEILKINDSCPVVFVYTAPKVGSTSIVNVLRIFAHGKLRVIHIHDNTMLEVLRGISDVSINEIIKYNGKLGRSVYVIDVYRNPIEHKMSYFFEMISYHFNNSLHKISSYSLGRITERFNQLFPHIDTDSKFIHRYGLTETPAFDHDNKFLQVKLDGVKYIALRLCDSNQWGKILSKVLNIEPIHMGCDYKTCDKSDIGVLYTNFTNKYLIPQNIFDDVICTNKDAQFFMSSLEYNLYLEKWRKKIGPSYIYLTSNQYSMYESISASNCQFNEIQINHYTDDGCSCNACEVKRKQLIQRAVSGGTYDGETNHHNTSNREYIVSKVNQFSKNITPSVRKKTLVGRLLANIVR
jgi:hypothetical protein